MDPRIARNIIDELFKQYKLNDWKFEYDMAAQRFGACNYRTKTIKLSGPLTILNDEDAVRDTILHEIAHALTPGQHHNYQWQSVARSIGCTGTRCYDNDVITPDKPYIGTCPNCKKTIERLRRRRIACVACCRTYNQGVFTERYLFTWVEK